MNEDDKNALEDAAKEIVEGTDQDGGTTEQPVNMATQSVSEASSEPPNAIPLTVNVPKEDGKSTTKKKLTKKKIIILCVVVVALLIASALASYFIFFNKEEAPVQQNTTDQQSTAKEEHPEEVILPTVAANKTATWLAEPEVLPTQPLFDESGLKEYYGGEVPSEGWVFYKAGTDGNKEIIIFTIASNGIGDAYAVAVKEGSSYELIQKNSMFFGEDGAYYGPKLADGVKVDETTAYEGLTPKDTITFNGVTASRSSEWAIETDMTDATEVAKTTDGTVYERIYSLEDQQGIKQYYIVLKQPSHTYVKYRYTTSVLKDDNTATIQWKDGTTTTGAYQWAMVWGGCGSIGSVNVLDKAYFGDLKEAGTVNGQTVYTLNSATHPVMNTIYKNFNTDGAKPGAPTQQQMYDDKGVIVVRNELGYRVILVSDKYQRAGECGKPVIYLYPESPTALTVSVGADVTKSEPLYGTGWNVFAMPDGKLLTSGGTYDSLFWEGIGNGNYPQITEGFVVKRTDVERTLWNHLKQLGLNQKESADFMEFWTPLLPDSNYVRLTWFGAQQMNELAPLSISQQPDTLIRIFLDFEGLDVPIQLPPQRLSHPERKGFVVVEWGGLLTARR